MKNKKIFLSILICIILMSIAVAKKQVENDIFYTIKIGEYISQNGIGNLTQDPFSFHDLSYTFPHWLYDLGMYTIYNVSGWNGIYSSTIIFTIILGILIFRLGYKKSKNEIISAALTLISLYILTQFLSARAQLISFSMIILTILNIEKLLETGKKRYGAALVVISLIEVNIHMAVWPFLFVIFLPYLAEYLSVEILNLIQKIKSKITKNKYIRKEEYKFYKIKLRKNSNIKKLFVTMIICALMGIFTPTGITNPYTYLYKTISGNTMETLVEHQPANIGTIYAYSVFTFGMIILLLFCNVKIDIKNIFFYSGLLILYLNTVRQLSMFVLIMTPIYCEILSNILNHYCPNLHSNIMNFLNKNTFANFIIILIVVSILFLSYNIYKPNLITKYYRAKDYPIDACKWIKENLDYKNIRILNQYNYGSYLLFEGISPIIDSRCDLYTPQYNTKTGNIEDGQDIFTDIAVKADKGIDVYETCQKYKTTYAIVSAIYEDLYREVERDTIHFEKIYPLEKEDYQWNNTFSIYKVNLDCEE